MTLGKITNRYDKGICWLLWSVLAVVTALPSQTQVATSCRYDVVSIKPNRGGTENMGMSMHDDVYQARNVSLKMLLSTAYGVRQGVISELPKWAIGSRWDIEAKISDADAVSIQNISADQRQGMLRQLLADGFKLRVHQEDKVQRVLDLVVAKGGLKMKKSALGGQGSEAPKQSAGMSMGNGRLDAVDVPVSGIAHGLEAALDLSVVDKTGLEGNWDASLRWTPDGEGDSGSGISLYTALEEQLGLKLESTRGLVKTLVIDHAEIPRPE